MFYDSQWVSAWSGEPGRGWRKRLVLLVRRRTPPAPEAPVTPPTDTETQMTHVTIDPRPSALVLVDLQDDHVHPEATATADETVTSTRGRA